MKTLCLKLKTTALAAAVTFAVPAVAEACSHYPMPSAHPTISEYVMDEAKSVFIVEVIKREKIEPEDKDKLYLGESYTVTMAVKKTLKGDVLPEIITGVEFASDFPCPRNKHYTGKYRTIAVQNIDDKNDVGLARFFDVKDPEFVGNLKFPYDGE